MDVHRVEYHRNGVGGTGFFAVQFTDDADGCPRRLVSVVFPIHDEDETIVSGDIAVLDIDSLDQPLRGDDYWHGDLIDAVRRADQDGSAYVHASHYGADQ